MMIPLQITMFLSESMVLNDHGARLMTLDNLLAWAHYQETGDLSAGDALPLARLTHPNGQWVYHASTWRAVSHLAIEPMTIYKRTSGIALDYYGLTHRWERGRGPTKDYELTYHTFATPAIRFYSVGDPDAIQHLLKNLSFIGGKRSLGKGRIWKIDIDPIEHDRSLHDGGFVTRPIPIALAGDWKGSVQHVGYKSPYWHPDNKTRCVVPAVGPLIEEEEIAYATRPLCH